MSEVKLNLRDADNILVGTIHGSVVDRCVAALSAEPETIGELESALARYQRPSEVGPFKTFRSPLELDPKPYDAGIVIIDLTARVIAVDSTYSSASPEGEVHYHDGEKATDISIPYRLPDDWRFVSSAEAYRWTSERRRQERQANPPLDARPVLYGSPLFEFIKNSVSAWCVDNKPTHLIPNENIEGFDEATINEIVRVHREWLMRPREDLRGKLPREVLLERQDFIDSDLDTRCLQWSLLSEGPPCLAPDSFAYRFAGFGTHEWVVYYDYVRYLIGIAMFGSSESARELVHEMKSVPSVQSGSRLLGTAEGSVGGSIPSTIADGSIGLRALEWFASRWLERANLDYDGRVPAIIIENERKRLPQTMSTSEVLIDDDCEICRMSAQEIEMGFGPCFWHLDGSSMEDEFAFSPYLTIQEYEGEQRRREEFEVEVARRDYEKRQWDEDQERFERGEPSDFEPF